MDTTRYLQRIGVSPEAMTPDRAGLAMIQRCHVQTVPYENTDILKGIPISLEPQALFDKIVTRRRGGYCFELNGALSHLLSALGFSVKNYMARFLKGESEIPVRRHRVVVVALEDARYVVEVGIGQNAPRFPLLLEEETVQSEEGESYRFLRDGFLGWVLQELREGEWRPYYSFTEEEQLDIDYIQPSFYCERHPDSPFHRSLMLSIKTADGRRTVNGRDYKVFRGDTLIHLEEGIDEARLEALMSEYFFPKR